MPEPTLEELVTALQGLYDIDSKQDRYHAPDLLLTIKLIHAKINQMLNVTVTVP